MDQHATRGLILHQVKYSDSSIILKVYTEQYGPQSYIMRGVRKKNKKTGMAILQPMTLVELVGGHSSKSALQYVKEIRIASVYKDIPFNMSKSSVLMFLNEVLYKVLKEESANMALFSFLFHSMEFFDQYEGPIANFHLLFLIHLSKYLGVHPRNNYSERDNVFDFMEGKFTHGNNENIYLLDAKSSHWLHELLNIDLYELKNLNIPYAVRLELNNGLIDYYKLHIPGLEVIKSLEVVQSILKD